MKPEFGTGRERTLHRNLLLPCDMLIDTDAEEKSQNHNRCVRAPKPRKPSVIEHDTDGSDTDSEDLPIFLSVFQPERIVAPDDSSAVGANQGATLPDIMADNEQEADLASLPQSIAEDSLSQSELSPIAPAFSPPSSVSSESSNGSGNNRNQRPLCIRNPPIMLNYDRF